ncbi:MAG: NAD(P)/FAD-dependent oxidoreductase [Bacillota bacterium]
MLDVLIIGGGVIGCAIARELSRYKLDIALVEAKCDVGKGTSSANSGIVHAGYDPKPGTLKARFNVKGNLMFDKLAEELEFAFHRCGSYVIAFNDDDMKTIDLLLERGKQNGVSGLIKMTREEILEREPNVNPEIKGGMFHNSGVCASYELVIALAENAMQNGVSIFVDNEVTAIKQLPDATFEVTTTKDVFHARHVINCAGIFADVISEMAGAEVIKQQPRRGDYFIYDKKHKGFVNTVIFPCPGPMGKGVLVIPMPEGNMIIGPSSTDTDLRDSNYTLQEELDFVWNNATHCCPNLPRTDVISSFMGLRAEGVDYHDFYIKASDKVKGFINLSCIASPGLTSSPAIAEYVAEILRDELHLKMEPNPHFNPKREGVKHFFHKTWEEREQLIKENPEYGRIVCRCETVTEGEIVDAIRRTPGEVTLGSIKYRTRAGMGRCQGGFCTCRIMDIIHRETGMPKEDITTRGDGSNIVVGKIKQFAAEGGTEDDQEC